MAVTFERDGGLIGRMWVFPVHRASALTGRLLAEAARTLASSALITVVGVGLGLRFRNGGLAVIPFMLVPVLIVVPFSMAVIAITVRAKTSAVLVWLSVPSIGAVFASSGVVPLQSLPSAVRLRDPASADVGDGCVDAGTCPGWSGAMAVAGDRCCGSLVWPQRSGHWPSAATVLQPKLDTDTFAKRRHPRRRVCLLRPCLNPYGKGELGGAPPAA